MSDKTNTDRLAGLIQKLSADILRPEKGMREVRDFTQFSEVFRGIEDLRRSPVPASHKRETENLREKKPRQSNEVEQEKTPLVREDAAPQRSSDAVEKRGEIEGSAAKETEAEVKMERAQVNNKDQPFNLEGNQKNTATALSTTNQHADINGANAKGFPAEQKLAREVISDSLKNTPGVEHSSLKNNEAAAALKAAMNLMQESEEARGEVADQTKAELKTAWAKALLAKQGEVGRSQSSQTAVENPHASPILKFGPNTEASTSIVGNFQGLARLESLGTEGGQQGGMGQGGNFSGNPALQHLSVLRSAEGTDVMQKTVTDFRAILDAGRGIPDERAVLRQVTQHLRAWRPGQDEPIRFLLEPKNLGMLQIDVMLQKSGLTAHMVTADPAVKALLEGNQQYLQNALNDQGLQLSQFSVDLGGRDGFMNGDQSAHIFKKVFPSAQSEAMDVQEPSSVLQHSSTGLSLYV